MASWLDPKGVATVAAVAAGVEGAGSKWCLRKGGEGVGVVGRGGGSGGDCGGEESGFLDGFGEGLSVAKVSLGEPEVDEA